MTKLVLKTAVLIMACLSTLVFAKTQDKAIDPYSQCVDDTIQQLKLGNINNAVVEICSTRTKTLYAKQIVQVLDQIKKQSQEYKQLERYQNIMKSQQLLKNLSIKSAVMLVLISVRRCMSFAPCKNMQSDWSNWRSI